MYVKPISSWLKQALFQLVIVAALGCLLRYKMLFPFPWLEQKHLLHAHSHFAFAGWITQALYILLVELIWKHAIHQGIQRYTRIFQFNLLSAWGMLFGFAAQGYGAVSTMFAALSIGVSYWFVYQLWFDLHRNPVTVTTIRWVKLALVALVLSSTGTWYLAFLQIAGTASTTKLLLAVYAYLHFQYNGWFLFGILALLFGHQQLKLLTRVEKRLWYGWAITLIPAYLLSALWLPFGQWERVALALVAAMQLTVWIPVWWSVKQARNTLAHWVWWLPLTAISIKLLLQLGSVYPPLSTLAFGIRPIVIGYLHLVLLGIVSLSILLLLFQRRAMRQATSLWIFITGVILNELLLLTQGGMALGYLVFPAIKYALLVPAALLLFGAIGMWKSLNQAQPA